MRWTPELIAEARRQTAAGITARAVAADLSQRFGVAATKDSVRQAMMRAPVSQHVPPMQPPQIRPPVAQYADPSLAAGPRSGVPRSIAILADLHIPDEDKPALAAAMAILKERQPDEVVLLGDVGEFESCSQHSPSLQRYSDDLAAVRGFLQRLRELVPDARITLAEGNHESRFRRTIGTLLPTLAGAHRIETDLGLAELGIEYIPEDAQPIRRGKLVMLHGHQIGTYLPKYVAAKLADVYGEAGGTVVCAHGHREQWYERPMAGGNAIGVSLPCLRTLRPTWLHGREAGWSHGMAWVTLEGGAPVLEQIEIREGPAYWGGVTFGTAA